MNRLVMAFFILSLSLNTTTAAKQETQQPQQRPDAQQPASDPIIDAEGAEILGHFAGIVGSFLNLVQAPNDSANVGQHLGGMIHGLANIVTTAMRGGKNLEDFVNSQEFQQQAAQLITKRVQCVADELDQL